VTSLAEHDRRHVWHPYTQHATAAAPVPITRAEGAYLYRDDGRPIFDAISSWWVTLHGHAHPAIAAAIARQAATLEQVIFAGFTHQPGAELAAALVRLLPAGLERVFYSDDGSTAVEVALKLALQYWHNRGEHRPVIAALEHAYHGDTFGAMAASDRSVFTAPFSEHLFRVERLPDPSVDAEQTLHALDRLLDGNTRRLAAVIVEPLLLGAGGMRLFDPQVLTAIRARTRAAGVLLIADEVLTGFGRTGPAFACERASIEPDIVCLSKGLTGGFLPLGATAVREEIFAGFLSPDRRRTFFHGHSYTANPIACAAALASLGLLDSSSARARHEIECTHQREMTSLSQHPAVKNARVIGTIAAFDFQGDGGYLHPVGPELASFALERGVLLRPLGNVVYFLPPYCSTADDLVRAYDVVRQFLERLPA